MEVAKLLLQAGIVGCGGAGFPTHAKYSGNRIETIIINGAECEPLLQTDRYLMRNKAGELIKAVDMLMKETKASGCVIALKHSYEREIMALENAIGELSSSVCLCRMASFFPAGDEQTVVYEVTKKVVPPGGIPLDVGCVVSNIATLHCIYEAMEGRPFTRKFLTVTGEVQTPIIAYVPIGTSVAECLKLAGGAVINEYVVINGGPMMGKLMTREEAEAAFVTKTMSGLILLPSDGAIANRSRVTLQHMLNRAKSACIQCSFCSQLCPRALLGHPLQPHRIMRRLAACGNMTELLHEPDIQNAALCCECGICEIYACPMGLQPRRINSMLKGELTRTGVRYCRPEGKWSANPERDLRKAPTKRVAARAGVGPYESIRIDNLRELLSDAVEKVHMTLRQGIGAPSLPIVKDGEWVKEGQLIAVCPEGSLGSSLHASISGVVTVGGQDIIIEKENRQSVG